MENAPGWVEVDLSQIPPPTPIPAPTLASDLATLMAALDWARGMVRKVILFSNDPYSKSNLTSIANAMDPELNPRLGPVYERNQSHGK